MKCSRSTCSMRAGELEQRAACCRLAVAVLLVFQCSIWAVGAVPWLTSARQVGCFGAEPSLVLSL